MLQQIRSAGKKWYVILPLCLTTLFFSSCAKESSVSTTKKTDYSAETLFSGIVFGRGPVSDLIPEIAQNKPLLLSTPVETQAIENLQSEILSIIKTSNPTFLDHFKAKIESGDRSEIQSALEETRTVVLDAIQRSYNVPKPLLSQDFITKARNLLPADANYQNIKEAVAAKKDEFKALIAKEVGTVSASPSNLALASGKANANVEVNYNVYLNVNAGALASVVAIAVVITVAAVFVAVAFAETESTMDGLSYSGKQSDLLLKEQTVNSIANLLTK